MSSEAAVKSSLVPRPSSLVFPPWYGEFGWEVMTWAPLCRRAAQGYDEIVVTSFADMAPLYADFATEFRSHGETKRRLDYPKRYHADGLHYRYGRPDRAGTSFDLLIHARGISRKNSINYHLWPQLIERIHGHQWSVAVIGSPDDMAIADCGWDLRGLELQELMDVIAASRVVIGVSSGTMHLSAACGTDLVVWGDTKTRYWETLEKRYKETWNPHGVNVGWIAADDWQPEPERIIEEIERILTHHEGHEGHGDSQKITLCALCPLWQRKDSNEDSFTQHPALAGRPADVHAFGA